MTIAKGILIKGRVQGVGFRYSAVEKAVLFEIYGYVKNNPDGSVFIHAEGSNHAMEEFILWCHSGPSRSVIKSVTISQEEIAGYREFFVK